MVMAGVNAAGGVKKTLFEKAIRDKTFYLNNNKTFTHKLYDKIVFSKVKNVFGGNIKIMITASAPIAADVLTFFKIALGIHIYECYGQTEMCGPATLTLPQDPTAGHVGGCVGSAKLRLRDVPEMGYFSTDNPPRGEIQYFGTNMFVGYFKAKDKTQEAFTEDGWLNSGDVAIIYPNGSVKIIDRAKNIFKLS